MRRTIVISILLGGLACASAPRDHAAAPDGAPEDDLQDAAPNAVPADAAPGNELDAAPPDSGPGPDGAASDSGREAAPPTVDAAPASALRRPPMLLHSDLLPPPEP